MNVKLGGEMSTEENVQKAESGTGPGTGQKRDDT